jgi:hypothetical protein
VKPLPWSHTVLESFLTCPRRFYEIRVLKSYPDEQSEAGKWGDRFHKIAADYLEGKTGLPEEMAQYQTYLDAIANTKGDMQVELKLALDTSLSPCDFFTGKNIFARAVVDVFHLDQSGGAGKAIDHKTGKRKSGSRQMKQNALLLFAHYPQMDRLRVAFMWLKEGKRDSEEFTREDIPRLWLEFLPDLHRYKEAFNRQIFNPHQSGLCKRHCPVLSCEFNGRNR